MFSTPEISCNKREILKSPTLSCGTEFRLVIETDNATNPHSESSDALQFLSLNIARLLEISCFLNDPNVKLPSSQDKYSEFFSGIRQKFALEEYIKYLMEETEGSASVFILAYLYLQRVQAAAPLLKINSYNVHRLYFTCVVLASKYLEHAILSNKAMASIGGLSCLKEMNTLELSILSILKYRLGCDVNHYMLLCFVLLR